MLCCINVLCELTLYLCKVTVIKKGVYKEENPGPIPAIHNQSRYFQTIKESRNRFRQPMQSMGARNE